MWVQTGRRRVLLNSCRSIVTGALGIVAIASFWVVSFTSKQDTRASLPVLTASSAEPITEQSRDQPFIFAAQSRRLIPLSNDELGWLHQQIQPPVDQQISVSACYHLLRVHGLKAQFEHATVASGVEITRLLTDDIKSFGYYGRPALIRTSFGVRFPTLIEPDMAGARALEAHRDQCLAALGELGMPLSYELKVSGAASTLRAVLQDSFANFHLAQEEMEWTALAYALYVPPVKAWENKYGERYSFDDLTNSLLQRRLDRISCAGTHVMYTLTALARVDRQEPVLSEPVRRSVMQRLRRAVEVAVQNQKSDGSWDLYWCSGLQGSKKDDSSFKTTLDDQLLATGHIAEWMLYLPEDLKVPDHVLQRAGDWLYRQLRLATPQQQWDDFCPYSHAACVVRRLAYVSDDSVEIGP